VSATLSFRSSSRPVGRWHRPHPLSSRSLLNGFIEKEDPDDHFGSRWDHGPFGIHDHLFSPASPSQGPFLEILEQDAAEGLKLVRRVVERATQWRRQQYERANKPFPTISIPFSTGAKTFEGDRQVYGFCRGAPSAITASALLALEAWGHHQAESGKPPEDVLHDILGPDRSSSAFVAVAVDVVLSHWETMKDVAWPLTATPRLLEFDEDRHRRCPAKVTSRAI